MTIRRDGSYLITGGCGGFGLETARWLADQGAGALVLVSRRGAVTPEALEAVAALERGGVQVMVAAVDVTDSARLADLLRAVASKLPPLVGVFHSAMVLDDDLLDRLDSRRLSPACLCLPRSSASWNLHAQTLDLQLDMFVPLLVDGIVSPRQSRSGWLRVGQRLLGLALACYRQALRSAGAGYQRWGAWRMRASLRTTQRLPGTSERTGMFGYIRCAKLLLTSWVRCSEMSRDCHASGSPSSIGRRGATGGSHHSRLPNPRFAEVLARLEVTTKVAAEGRPTPRHGLCFLHFATRPP